MNDNDLLALEFGGWPLPDAFLVELGRLGALWSTLESALNMCLTKLFAFGEDGSAKGLIIVMHSSFPQRLDMLGSLCERLVAEFPRLQTYKEVVSALRAAQSERNRFVHNGIGPSETDGEFEMAVGSARGSLKTNVRRVTIADIRKVSIVVSEVQTSLWNLVVTQNLASPPPAGWRIAAARSGPRR